MGHGDGEDQLKPKLVEALRGHKIVDVACGSGDSQTLCISDDGYQTYVWSFGDGGKNSNFIVKELAKMAENFNFIYFRLWKTRKGWI